MLDANAYYMNPFTGSVDKGENWLCENIDKAHQELDSLIEVERNGPGGAGYDSGSGEWRAVL